MLRGKTWRKRILLGRGSEAGWPEAENDGERSALSSSEGPEN